MSKALKTYLREDLKSRMGDARSAVVLRLDKLDVARANELRTRLRKEGARMTVLRNRVARYAFEDLGMRGVDPLLKGMSAVAYGRGADGVLGVSKVLSDWSRRKDAGIEILGGYVDGQVISASQVESLATLPSKEQLLAMIASVVVAPVQSIASQVNDLIAGVARAVDAVRVEKDKAA